MSSQAARQSNTPNGFGSEVERISQVTSRGPNVPPNVTGLQSSNGRWKFPADQDLPEPRQFEGTPKHYPSGRTAGCTVEPAISTSMKKSSMPPANIVQQTKGKGASPLNLIDDKVSTYNKNLKAAIEREEFELCTNLRNKIKVQL